jgi:hypothetical protein
MYAADACRITMRSAFFVYFLRVLVISKIYEARMAEVIGRGPVGELYLRHELRLHPTIILHRFNRQRFTAPCRLRFGQIVERAHFCMQTV